jgi:hypothetical protein
MTQVASILAGAALLLAAAHPAGAAETASAPARADIVDPAGVRMNWAMALPSVKGDPSGATFLGTMPSYGMGMLMPGNARLMLRPRDDYRPARDRPDRLRGSPARAAIRDAEARLASVSRRRRARGRFGCEHRARPQPPPGQQPARRGPAARHAGHRVQYN